MDFDLRLRMGGHFSKPTTWLVICLRKMARLLQAHANLRSVEDAVEDSRYSLASAAARVS